MNRARSALRRQIFWTVVSTVATWAIVPLMGLFIARHREIEFVVPAAAIGLYFIGNMIAQIQQVRSLADIKLDAPIAIIQKKISSLVMTRIRYARWIFMSMMLTWVPLTIVAFKGLFGMNLYQLAPRWLIANLLFGIVFIPFAMWVSKKHAQHSESPGVQRLMRDIAGTNLGAAAEFVATLREFEEEKLAA